MAVFQGMGKMFWNRRFRSSGNRAAFTLIELLIVVAIIGILAAIAVPNFMNARMRAKVTRAMEEERNVSNALEMYRIDQAHYPPKDEVPGTRLPVYKRYAMLTTPVAYMASIPLDPFFPVDISQDPRALAALWGGTYYDYFEWQDEGYIYKAGPRVNKLYFIASYGPDFQKTVGEVMGVQDMVPYDLSNGIVSAGDIVRYGP